MKTVWDLRLLTRMVTSNTRYHGRSNLNRTPRYKWWEHLLLIVSLLHQSSKLFIQSITIPEYRNKLFETLESYILNKQKPSVLPPAPPTLASLGEQYPLEELIERQQSRPGIESKRHWVSEPTPEENRPRYVPMSNCLPTCSMKFLIVCQLV